VSARHPSSLSWTSTCRMGLPQVVVVCMFDWCSVGVLGNLRGVAAALTNEPGAATSLASCWHIARVCSSTTATPGPSTDITAHQRDRKMGDYRPHNSSGSDPCRPGDPCKQQNDIYTQLVISVALGLSAFLSFCVGQTAPGEQPFVRTGS
jgi:hypothetical protein